jgi:hypothetical protein
LETTLVFLGKGEEEIVDSQSQPKAAETQTDREKQACTSIRGFPRQKFDFYDRTE